MGRPKKGPRVQFNARIEPETMEKIRSSGHRYEHIVRLGLLAIEENPQLRQQIRDLEAGNDRLQKKITMLSKRLGVIEKER